MNANTRVENAALTAKDLTVTRVRHALKLRLGRVARVLPITPYLTRVTLSGEDLRDFESASFDDHMKVFFPEPGAAKPVLPTLGPQGPEYEPGAARPTTRDFTPRRFDREAGELDIEFALHDAGPATTWAAQARPGEYLGIGGPRGSMIIPTWFDWHLLIGDDTALPAIARRLEDLPSGAKALVVAEVVDADARIDLHSRADVQVVWAHRAEPNGRGLIQALEALPPLPTGQGFAWAAAESAVVRQVRVHLLRDRGIDKSRMRTAAYWKRGASAIHEVPED
jgi:NADPH-dependent ferric siderophore reductase